MISQLSLKKRVVFALSVFLLIGQPLSAKKYELSGVVVGTDGEPVKKAQVSIVVDGKTKKDKTNRKGIFKFKRIPEGEYTINVSHEEQGMADLPVILTEDKDVGEIPLSGESAPVTVAAKTETEPKETKPEETAVPKTKSAAGGASSDFILNELNFEIKKLTAEFKHLSREMDDLKALSKMWINPLTIYSKEIILKNGSTVFGKIVYQDDKSLKLETLVGYLIIERDQVVRIIDNVITEDQQEYVPEQIR